MDILKCNLFIVGNPGVGKTSLLKILEEFIHNDKRSYRDSVIGPDWIIKTDKVEIEVEIKEFRNFELPYVISSGEKVKTVLLYVAGYIADSIAMRDIEQLKAASKQTTVIIASTFGYNRFEELGNQNAIRKALPFIEYFLRIGNINYKDHYELFEFGSILRKIITNLHPGALQHAKNLIKTNLESKNPTLDLGNCGLTSLNDIKELFDNIHLKKLILSNEWGQFEDGWKRRISNNKLSPNILFSLPVEISKLKSLEILIAGGDWKNSRRNSSRYFSNSWYIRDVNSVAKLQKLSILNLSNNQIESFAPLKHLNQLTKLYLNNNTASTFPDINNYPKLEQLYLSNNVIKNPKFLSFESSVQTVDLHSNRISDLTSIKDFISKIGVKDSKWESQTLSIAGNPLSIPPAEVVAQGTRSVLAYFSQLEAEKEIRIKPYKNADIKLILVGNSNVGKSTFFHWLKTGMVDKTIATTHWLNFGEWKAVRNSKTYTVRVFDFGGQEYYHDTHHLFFTNRTAYALLWEKRSNHFDELEIEQAQNDGTTATVKIETFPIEYWLDSIRYHTQKRKLSQVEKSINKILDERDAEIRESVRTGSNWVVSVADSTDKISDVLLEEEENILVLQNKVDSNKSKLFLNEAAIRTCYPKVYDFEQMSIYNEERLELSKNILFDIFESLEVLNRQYLGTWNYIKKEIENTNFTTGYTGVGFLRYCNKIIRSLPELEGKTPSKVKNVLFSLDDAKVFASFLADIGLCLYYPENGMLSDKIFLNQDKILADLNKILLAINRTTGEISKSAIAAALNKKETNTEVQDIINLMLHFKILFNHPLTSKKAFIAPLYLPNKPPKSLKLFQSMFEKPVYRFQFETFIHKSVILDMFQAYGSKALSETSDGSSFYLWKNGIVIKNENSNDIVMVKFIPWNSKSKLATLDIYVINSTNDEFVKTIVSYIDSINQGINYKKMVPNDSREEFIPLDLIHLNEKEQNPIFHFNNKYYRLTSFRKYLNSPLKMKKIFISYSKQDLRLVTKFLEHLSGLQRDGKVSHWYCSELEAGSKWNDEIQKHFEEADIACFMISPNFMRTDYIHEHEIKKAFERKAIDPNFKIVPIILNFCRWTSENNNLGDYTALPYTAKPITDFKNQDMGWYIVEECIRLMIDNDLEPKGDDFYTSQKLPQDVLKIYMRIVEGKVDDNSN